MSRGEARQLAVELLGAAILCAAAIGAGLLAERFPGQVPLSADWLVALIAGAALAVLMFALPGARFNPALTLADIILRRQETEPAAWRAGAQVAGAIVGVAAAHAAFDMGAIQHAGRAVTGPAVWAGEAAATFVFVLAVGVALQWSRAAAALAAGLALVLVYLATPALSLANPALLIARTLTDSYLGVRPGDAPVLLVCQLAGAVLASLACAWLIRMRRPRERAAER